MKYINDNIHIDGPNVPYHICFLSSEPAYQAQTDIQRINMKLIYNE